MTKLDEEKMHDIFLEIKTNRNKGLDRLFKTYYKQLYGISYSILKNKEDADEVLQILFLKLMKIDNKLLPSSKEWTWIYSVTKNTSINYIRKNKASFNIDEMYNIKSDANDIEEVLDREKFNKMISCLNNDEKEIVSLKIISDLSFNEIAGILNMPEGTVKWKYYKALNTVKSMLGSALVFLVSGLLYFKMQLGPKEIVNVNIFPEGADNNFWMMLLKIVLSIISVVFGILTVYFACEFIKRKRRKKSLKWNLFIKLILFISIIINAVMGTNIYKINKEKNQIYNEMIDMRTQCEDLNNLIIDLEQENEFLKDSQNNNSSSNIIMNDDIILIEPDNIDN